MKKKLLFSILATSMFSITLLFQTVPTVSAYYWWYGPYQRQFTVEIWDSYYNEHAVTVTMYVKYYFNWYYNDVKVAKVKVTIDYLWSRVPDGYIELRQVVLCTGVEPLNTLDSCIVHWYRHDMWLLNYNWDPPSTYQAYPNSVFDVDTGVVGKYGIIERYPPDLMTYQLLADGNQLYLDTDISTTWCFRFQFAWQFWNNVVLIYQNGQSFASPFSENPLSYFV